jgi:hypothetical protein
VKRRASATCRESGQSKIAGKRRNRIATASAPDLWGQVLGSTSAPARSVPHDPARRPRAITSTVWRLAFAAMQAPAAPRRPPIGTGITSTSGCCLRISTAASSGSRPKDLVLLHGE